MDARLVRLPLVLCALFVCTGATHRTRNFTVHAPTVRIAQSVGKTAEHWRIKLAKRWTGRELPPWSKPCPIKVKVGQIGAGGATRFSFDRGHVFNWNMTVQGTLERILDSVIPHEVNHTILACHFRRPIPRWADEGAATLCEHESERRRQLMLLQDILNEKRRIPLRKLLSIREYPKQMDKVMTLYAQGYSLADFLVQQRGHATFLKFLDDANNQGWEFAIRQNYRHQNVESLEQQWSGWFLAGSPRLDLHKTSTIASNNRESDVIASRSSARPINVRSQTPARKNRTPGIYGDDLRQRLQAPEAFNARSQRQDSGDHRRATTINSSHTPRSTSDFTGPYEFQKPVFPLCFLSNIQNSR